MFSVVGNVRIKAHILYLYYIFTNINMDIVDYRKERDTKIPTKDGKCRHHRKGHHFI